MDWPAIKPSPLWCEARLKPPELWHSLLKENGMESYISWM